MTNQIHAQEPIHVRSRADLLALIPHQIGEQPHECAVLFFPLLTGGGLCLRLGMPTPGMDVGCYAEQLSEAVYGVDHAGTVAVVIYTASATLDDHLDAFHTAGWLGLAAIGAGLHPVDGIVVGPTHWWDLWDPDEPRPVSEIVDSPVNAHLITTGSTVRDDAAARARTLSPEVRERAQRLRGRLAASDRPDSDRLDLDRPDLDRPDSDRPDFDRPDSGRPHEGPERITRDLEVWWRVLDAVSEDPRHWLEAWHACSDAELVELAGALGRPCSRDALLYSWLTGDSTRARTFGHSLSALVEDEPERTPEAGSDEDVARALLTLSGQSERRPDWARMEAAYRVVEAVEFMLECALDIRCSQHGDLDGMFAGAPRRGLRGPATMAAASRGEPGRAECELDGDFVLVVDRLRALHADTIAVRAQLEAYRGRSFTAHRLLERARTQVPLCESVASVLERLHRVPVPWWAEDRRTAWPGEGWWEREACDDRREK